METIVDIFVVVITTFQPLFTPAFIRCTLILVSCRTGPFIYSTGQTVLVPLLILRDISAQLLLATESKKYCLTQGLNSRIQCKNSRTNVLFRQVRYDDHIRHFLLLFSFLCFCCFMASCLNLISIFCLIGHFKSPTGDSKDSFSPRFSPTFSFPWKQTHILWCYIVESHDRSHRKEIWQIKDEDEEIYNYDLNMGDIYDVFKLIGLVELQYTRSMEQVVCNQQLYLVLQTKTHQC